MPHLIFHVVAENEQKQHVARQMHKSGMQEHGCDERIQLGARADLERDDGPGVIELEKRTLISLQGQGQQKDPDVQRHQRVSDVGYPARRVVIADRKHGMQAGLRRRSGQEFMGEDFHLT